nr:FAR1 DNA binding domain-containing protein [Tanacetum cinerariifolium]GEW84557.1 FAR1 DNA binding domain-containing protein [Tanacetum cinerariifolium]
MTTSSTSNLLPATSTTTNLPPATSTTTNLPPATSTTSHLLPATSLTSHLPPTTSSTSHLLSSISTAKACNINEANLFVVPVIGEENILIEAKMKELDDVTMNEDVEANVNLEPGKYEITKFVAKHNHQLLPKEYNHLTKKQRKMPQAEKMFVVRASTMRLGATKAHNLYSKMKGGTQDLIPPALRRNTNRYGEKDEAIEKLTNEVNLVVDECLFLLRKDKEQLKQFVENLENIKKEIQVKVPNPPSQKTGDVIEDIYAIKKPKEDKQAHKNYLPVKSKIYCKTSTIEAAAEQERRTATSATEQEERNNDSTHIADKEQSNTAS